ncbi:tol-pal system YbgF family protein [Streptomyces sp. NPDC048581]|uniref:tetratricopeptide repeat protein n=1 Tax=Streptomyces sp. NPDC048581 TaxID=3365572 RepID=UPI00371BE7E6
MNDQTPAVPAMPDFAPDDARPHDPLAVAVGNASLLGVGYLMLRRRRLAIAAAVVTVVLVSQVVSRADSAYEVAVLVWWVAVVGHGWFLARRGAGGGTGGGGGRASVRGRRIVALGVTLPVLLAVGLLRFDASRIGQSVADARERGDCAGVLSAQDEVWFGHRIADAPLSARGDDVVQACERLRTARAELATALSGDTDALKHGFGTLASVLAQPGNEKTVETTLDGFLRGLPTKDACDTVTVTDWLHDRKGSDDVLDRSADTAERTAPAALMGCGDDLMADDDWEQARTHYQQLLDRYPDNDLADRARKGARQATLSIELANVRSLLADRTDGQPEYCSSPAKYSGAKPLGKGTNRALFYPDGEYAIDHSEELPGSWKADGPTDAVLVVCMGDTTFGSSVETCSYYKSGSSGAVSNVTFYKIAIPVKVYELRTGKLVANRTIQINGTSCPGSIYTSADSTSEYVVETKSDVRSAFRPLVVR